MHIFSKNNYTNGRYLLHHAEGSYLVVDTNTFKLEIHDYSKPNVESFALVCVDAIWSLKNETVKTFISTLLTGHSKALNKAMIKNKA